MSHRDQRALVLGQTIERDVRPVAAPRHAIRRLLDAAQAEGATQTISEDQTSRDRTSVLEGASDGPVIKFVADRLNDAIAHGASDVHVSSDASGLSIRFRMNGVLLAQDGANAVSADAVIARLKVLSNMNVAERRRPQDGRMTVVLGGRVIDFLMSSVPTQHGESIVCRVLDPKAVRLGWDALGFDIDTQAAVRAIIERPNGLFLVTGPTGSGWCTSTTGAARS